ncbi:MAG: hypothetical protein IKI75_05695 [Lachnospiraceae bacterium]|nr:hypothetical protein [Lachnospiraceae bacterium]
MGIVIPVYQKKLNVFERISLLQVFKVLENYPISIVAPESLDIDLSNYGINVKAYTIERFKDDYFINTESYSCLCLEEEFYNRFLQWDYLLIHQLDAFVFSDRLDEFVNMGYDYYGAAVSNVHWKDYHVGNGGLSLRQIKKTISVIQNKDSIMESVGCKELFYKYEDLFFGYCGFSEGIEYNTAPIEVANSFSVEDDTFGGFRKINELGLPFGTHRWYGCFYFFWRPIIEAYGYVLPAMDSVSSIDLFEVERNERLYNFFVTQFVNLPGEKEAFLHRIGMDRRITYAIWGKGYYGKACMNMLKRMDINVHYFIDNAASVGEIIDEIPVFFPEEKNITSIDVVILAVYGREKEIIDQIKVMTNKDINIISWFDIFCGMEDYVSEVLPYLEGITKPITINIPGGVNGVQIRYPYDNKARTYKAMKWGE